MPLGQIFGVLLFLVLAAAFLAGFPSPAGGLQLIKILVGASLPFIAVGLILRRPWARWLALAAGLALAWIGFVLANSFGRNAVDVLILLSGVILAVLFAVPATGNARRGMLREELRRSPAGVVAGCVAAVLLTAGCGLFGLVILSGRAAETASGGPGTGRVAWHDFAAGQERAEAEGKPMLVDFYTDWCGFCKQMDRTTFRNPEVLEKLGDVVPVKVNAESREMIGGVTGEELARRYQAYTYPTLVLLNGRGEVVSRARGAMPTSQFLIWLDAGLGRYATGAVTGKDRPGGLVM